MIACPKCGGHTSLMAGIVLYEHRNRDAYPHAFDVCWRDNIHRQRGGKDWLPLGGFPTRSPDAMQWTQHTPYHFSMFLHGQQLHWWPTKKKVSWHGTVRKGFDKEKAVELARRIADNAGLRL